MLKSSLRRWIDLKPHNLNKSLKMTSFNLLADCNLKTMFFKNRDIEDVKMKNRKLRIFSELETLNSDIYCFQEVDLAFVKEMEVWGQKRGLESQFQKKSDPGKFEGSLTLFDSSKFTLLKRYHANLNLEEDINLIEMQSDSQLGKSRCQSKGIQIKEYIFKGLHLQVYVSIRRLIN